MSDGIIFSEAQLYTGTYPRKCPRFSLMKSIGYLGENWGMRMLGIKGKQRGSGLIF
jgi:hypothetical protein